MKRVLIDHHSPVFYNITKKVIQNIKKKRLGKQKKCKSTYLSLRITRTGSDCQTGLFLKMKDLHFPTTRPLPPTELTCEFLL